MTARAGKKRNSKNANAGVSAGADKDIMQRLGLGSVPDWLFGTVAALTAATLILNSDGLTLEGDNILIALAWSLLAAVLLLVRRHRKSPFRFDDAVPQNDAASQNDTASQNTGTQNAGAGWRWYDLVAAAFFAWVLISFAAVWLSGNGSPRAMLTMLAHWCGFAGMFVTWRLLLGGRRMIRGMLLLFVALVIAETTVAYYDYCHLGPKRRAAFSANPEQAFLENNALTPGERELLTNRIESVEPLGTYSLTNSLAGVLAPWCVFLCGLALSWQSRSRPRHWPMTLLVAAMIACVGFILLMTHSRSGVLATAFGIACLIVGFIAARVRNKRVLLGLAAVAIVAIIGVIGAGIASGKLGGDTISEATKSFGYRVQYWQSSSRMIADHPIFGCGIGNFREYYTQYKLPTASESIADPHNLFYEIATNAGLPALAAFVVLLAAAIVGALFAKAKNGDVMPNNDNFLNAMRANWRLYSPFVIGGLVGLVVAIAYSYTNYVPLEPDVAAFALAGFALGCVAFFPVIALMPLSLRATAPICLAVLTVNLLAAGGITFPHVNVTFWFLAALCFCVCDSPNASKIEATKPRRGDSAFLCAGLCLLALTIVLYPTAYLSNLRANTLLRNMTANSSQFAYLDKYIAQLERVVEQDPYRTLVWCKLCDAYLLEQREFPTIAQRRPDASDWRNVIAEQWSRNRIAHEMRGLDRVTLDGTTADALVGAIKSSPFSASMYGNLGDVFFGDYEKTQSQGSLDLAVVLYELAAARYPNQAQTYVQLALCHRMTGDETRQVENARKALELDDVMPHSDRKLPVELRQLAEVLAR